MWDLPFPRGADHRSRNQLSNNNGPFTANRQLVPNDFPFRVFADVTNNQSAIVRDSSQVTGSAGVFRRKFSGITSASEDEGVDDPTGSFELNGLSVRQVTPRNAPSVINAVFNFRSFRDGRASDIYTGRTPFGDSDTRANALVVSDGRLVAENVRLTNSSLASQAMGPPLNSVEMSYEGRTWFDIAHKLLGSRPLARQRVSATDSVLGSYVNAAGLGLASQYTYLALIQSAFQPTYWDSPLTVDQSGAPASATGYALAEYNFPLFFGLAIQAYERTLIADDTPFDRFAAGESGALTTLQVSGYLDFQTATFCRFCHSGAEFTRASFTAASAESAVESIDIGKGDALSTAFADTGFFKTGVRRPSEDAGLNGVDDFGFSFSVAARQALSPLVVAGAFKVPSLRNVEFTGPYFHNGSQATLEQVIEFYARGGDIADASDLPVEITPVPIDTATRDELVAFLKSLSDDRVRYERAPFDHPEICVPVGYPDEPVRDPKHPASAEDRWAGIPEVGRAGNAVPLQTFEELLKGAGNDGSRAHTLTDACRIPGLSSKLGRAPL